jgi:hypothetical protein
VLGVLGTLGVTPVPVRLPPWNPAYDAVVGTLIDVEGAASFARLTASGGLDQLAQQEEWNWPNVFRSAALVSAVDYVQALRVRTHLQRAMAESLRDVDVYVTVPFRGPSLVYTNLAGHPTVVTRCGRSDEGCRIHRVHRRPVPGRRRAPARVRVRAGDAVASRPARHRAAARNAAAVAARKQE